MDLARAVNLSADREILHTICWENVDELLDSATGMRNHVLALSQWTALIGWRDDRAEIWIHKTFTEGVEYHYD